MIIFLIVDYIVVNEMRLKIPGKDICMRSNITIIVESFEGVYLRIVISKESELRRSSCSRMGAIRPRIPCRN